MRFFNNFVVFLFVSLLFVSGCEDDNLPFVEETRLDPYCREIVDWDVETRVVVKKSADSEDGVFSVSLEPDRDPVNVSPVVSVYGGTVDMIISDHEGLWLLITPLKESSENITVTVSGTVECLPEEKNFVLSVNIDALSNELSYQMTYLDGSVDAGSFADGGV